MPSNVRKKTISIVASAATQHAAAIANQVQDAVNGCAILKACLREMLAMQDARRDPPESGMTTLLGDEFNQHPVLIIFMDKLSALARTQLFGSFTDAGGYEAQRRIELAHQACVELAAGRNVEWELIPL